MRNYEKEIEELAELLSLNLIDEATFRKKVDRINVKIENAQEKEREKSDPNYKIRQKEKRKKLIRKLPLIIIIIILFVLAINIISFMKNSLFNPMGKTFIKDPIQEATTGSTTIHLNGVTAKIKYLYTYSITGRVVATFTYPSTSIYNKLAPKDVGISWGVVSMNENHKKIHFYNTGGRALYHDYDYSDFSNLEDAKTYILCHISNNHLIPNDSTALKKIHKIKTGDFVTITGYLVKVFVNNKTFLESSTIRNDYGNGACEVMLVNDVEWHK